MAHVQEEELISVRNFPTAGEPENEVERLNTLRKCSRCNQFFRESNRDAANSWCVYHSGTYTDPAQLTSGACVGWSCCRVPKDEKPGAFGILYNRNSDALKLEGGCKKTKYHMEDEQFTQAMRLFPFDADRWKEAEAEYQRQEDERHRLAIQLQPLTPSNNTSELTIEHDPNYFAHLVSPIDTLMGLALKYHVSSDELKRVNRISTSSDLASKKYLYIPKNEHATCAIPSQVDPRIVQDQAIRSFMGRTKSSREEAQYYLDEAKFDLTQALELWKDDVAWDPKTNSNVDQNASETPGNEGSSLLNGQPAIKTNRSCTPCFDSRTPQ